MDCAKATIVNNPSQLVLGYTCMWNKVRGLNIHKAKKIALNFKTRKRGKTTIKYEVAFKVTL
jgi:hypothetical protein